MSFQSWLTHIALLGVLILTLPQFLLGGGRDTQSNEEIMIEVSRQAVDSFCTELKIPDTTAIDLRIENGEINCFFTQPLIESFHQHFASMYTRTSTSSVEVNASIAEVKVVYGESFSDGFFSARKCERMIDVAVRFTATRIADGKVLWAGTKTDSCSDTVYVDEISKLEESSKRVAIGTAPDRSMLERFIEPIIIAGAAGIAVYLFFTIRS